MTSWALGQGFTALLPHSLIYTRRTGYLVRLVDELPPAIFEDWDRVLSLCLSEAVNTSAAAASGNFVRTAAAISQST